MPGLGTFAVAVVLAAAAAPTPVATAHAAMPLAAPAAMYSMTFSDTALQADFPGGIPFSSLLLDRAGGRLTIVRTIDKASPTFARARTRGVIPEVRLTGPGISMTLSNVIITSVAQSSGNESPKETVSFNFGGLQIRDASPTPAPMMIRPNTIPVPSRSP